jgi:hypothetical protein
MIRIVLIFIIIFLVVRLFVNIGREVPHESEKRQPEPENKTKKGVPRELGEYVEYEEVKAKD